MKEYFLMDNVGRAKYTVNFSDGTQKYKDGSAFFGIRVFSNKRKMRAFEIQLLRDGYSEIGKKRERIVK